MEWWAKIIRPSDGGSASARSGEEFHFQLAVSPRHLCCTYGQLVVDDDDDDWLRSTGRDPMMVFSDAALREGIDY